MENGSAFSISLHLTFISGNIIIKQVEFKIITIVSKTGVCNLIEDVNRGGRVVELRLLESLYIYINHYQIYISKDIYETYQF